jgi:hypothetical protein
MLRMIVTAKCLDDTTRSDLLLAMATGVTEVRIEVGRAVEFLICTQGDEEEEESDAREEIESAHASVRWRRHALLYVRSSMRLLVRVEPL